MACSAPRSDQQDETAARQRKSEGEDANVQENYHEVFYIFYYENQHFLSVVSDGFSVLFDHENEWGRIQQKCMTG